MSEQDTDRRLRELEHQNKLLRERMEANMKISQAERKKVKAENDSAFERLRADMERYNSQQSTKIAEQSAKIAEQGQKWKSGLKKLSNRDGCCSGNCRGLGSVD